MKIKYILVSTTISEVKLENKSGREITPTESYRQIKLNLDSKATTERAARASEELSQVSDQ